MRLFTNFFSLILKDKKSILIFLKISTGGKMRGKKSLFIFFAISMLIFLISCGPSAPKNTLEKVLQKKQIFVAVHPVNPPFEFGSGVGIDGFDKDIMENIAKKLGVEVVWIKKSFDECFKVLLSGDADCVINALTITPEREKKFDFSIPYYETGQMIAVRKERTDIKDVSDLFGKKVGVQRDSTAENFLRSHNSDEKITIVTYDSFDDALFELNRKLLDAVVGDAPTLLYESKELRNIKVVGKLLTHEEYGIAFRKGDIEIREKINSILSKMKRDGVIDELIKKWGLNYKPEENNNANGEEKTPEKKEVK